MDGAGPKVLHVSQPISEGVARYVDDAVRDQRARGWDVALASPKSPALEAMCAAVDARHYVWDARRGPGPSVASEIAALRRIVRDADPDVLHLHSSKAGLVGRLAVRGRRPTMFTPHAWSFLSGGRVTRRAALGWERLATRWTNLLVCVSEAEHRRGETAGVRCRGVVLSNAVDLARFAPASEQTRLAARRELGLDAATPVAVCVGRLAHQKGQDVIIGCWPAVRARVPDAQLVLAGDGPERDSLASLATDGVTFLGALEDVRGVYAAADIVVTPSRWEGLSFVVLEALACGRSVVATDVDGMHEAIGTGPDAAGVVVVTGNASALVEAVVERLADRTLARTEGERARLRAARFDLRAWGDALAALTCDVGGC